MADARSFTGGRFCLVLDGSQNLGFVKSIKGGTIKGEVATHDLGPGNVRKKHLATIRYEAFTIEAGMGMSAGFYDWIRASFDKGHVTKTGEFIACDFDFKAKSSREFLDCHIAEVTFPALDGSSKEPAFMTIKLDPERIRYQPGDGRLRVWLIICCCFHWRLSSRMAGAARRAMPGIGQAPRRTSRPTSANPLGGLCLIAGPRQRPLAMPPASRREPFLTSKKTKAMKSATYSQTGS